MRVWLLVLVAACVDSDAVTCEDGTICPPNTACATVTIVDSAQMTELVETLCVRPDQLGSCEHDGDPCDTGGASGTCHGGACFANECGNRLVDQGEVCDDGNADPRDQCSLDCRSNLACGNGIVDAITGERCDDGNRLGHDGCAPDCIEAPRWERFDEQVPQTRSSPGFAFDLERRRYVVFGGTGNNTTLGDTLEWDGRRWHTPRVSAPPPRTFHVMAYDAKRRVTVLFGGGSGVADTWEWNGASWRLRQPAHAPPARIASIMTYDARRERIVMFGGYDERSGTFLDDHWEWDGVDWVEHTGVRPARRANASMAFDPVHDTLVLFGGSTIENFTTIYHADTWLFDDTGWRQVHTTGPARALAVLAFDPTDGRMMLAGGIASNGALQDTWTWTGSTWIEHLAAALPLRLSNQRVATDPFERHVTIFVGLTNTIYDGALLSWDGEVWRPQYASDRVATTLPPRAYPAFAYDGESRRLVVFGGQGNGNFFDDTWVWNDGWTTPGSPTAGPAARSHAGAAFDGKRRELLLFGGWAGGSTLFGDTWTWQRDTGWRSRGVTAPAARLDPALAYDPAREQIVLFGGQTFGTPAYRDDTWLWDGESWREVTPPVRPPPRSHATMAYDPQRQRIVLFGGRFVADNDASTKLDDTWEWDGQSWREITLRPSVPTARSGAGLAWNPWRQRMLLFGGEIGFGQSEFVGDTWEGERDPTGDPTGDPTTDRLRWRQVTFAETPPARFGAMLVPDPAGGMLLFGGARSVSPDQSGLRDSWRLVWEASSDYELCTANDGDHDGAIGCADRDCWGACTPLCPPLVNACPAGSACGDGTCNDAHETCRTCANDCGACPAACGDLVCEAAEATSCPGDCP